MNDEMKPTHREQGPNALRAVLQRLARASDDHDGALLVLFVLRTIALERRDEVIIELCPQDVGLLLTMEEPSTGLWHGELLALSMPTLRSLVDEMPELVQAFDRSERQGTLTLRTKATTAASEMRARMTPVALPSIGLLMAAGLLSGPSPTHGEMN
jgi:hypothetical protein